MPNLRLTITDQNQTIHNDVHNYFFEALIASLTAEPETIEELGTALKRFIKLQDDWSPFAQFKNGGNFDPYDAGVAVIDLAARVVASELTDLETGPEGALHVQCELAEDEVYVPYYLSSDWQFVTSIAEYESAHKGRTRPTPLDAREILYGRPLLEFIAYECLESSGPHDEQLFANIHAEWLMTAREDLRDHTPREVLLEKRHFMDLDLQYRALQWSFTKECPAPLPIESSAYRYSGFGTHENVLYYELIRYLLHECHENSSKPFEIEGEVETLEQLKSTWLTTPQEDYYDRTPAQIIEFERRRVNISMTVKEFIVDENCDACELAALHFGTPMIWHLDGCNQDDAFEFSSYKTREEYDENQRKWEDFNREFELDHKAGKYDKPFNDESFDPKPLDDNSPDNWPFDSDDDTDPPS